MRIVAEDSTITFCFNTKRFSSGAPFTLAGTPSMYARVDGNATEITAGFTLTADFDSKTGLNKVELDLSADAGYTAGSLVEVFIGAGTVDSVSVADTKVYEFEIGNTGSQQQANTRGMLALPAVASGANGGLPLGDANGDVTLANGPHGGSSAVITTERIIAISTTTNEPGIKATGNGVGAGILSTGGTDGHGFSGVGGATGGNGINGAASVSGTHGIQGIGIGTGHGINGQGGSTGIGIRGRGGSSSGVGIRAESQGGNSAGMSLAGNGSGAGLLSTGGTTGDGGRFVGGSGGGDGNHCATTAGVEIDAKLASDAMNDVVLPTDILSAAAASAAFVTKIQTGLSTLDAAGVRAAVGLASADLDTQLSAMKAVVDAILADTGTDGVAISSATRDAIATSLLDLAAGVEANRTVRAALKLILAAAAGKLSGAATTTVAIRDTNDTVDRITATVDADGNRTAVSYNTT